VQVSLHRQNSITVFPAAFITLRAKVDITLQR
jgi:hypothetical protein